MPSRLAALICTPSHSCEHLGDHFALDAIDDAAVHVVGLVAGVAQAQVDQLFGERIEIEPRTPIARGVPAGRDDRRAAGRT